MQVCAPFPANRPLALMRFPENARDDVMMTTTMLGVMMTVIVMPMLLRLLLTMMLIDDAGSLWPRKCRWTKSRPSRIRFHPSRAFCGALRSGADVVCMFLSFGVSLSLSGPARGLLGQRRPVCGAASRRAPLPPREKRPHRRHQRAHPRQLSDQCSQVRAKSFLWCRG